MKPRLTPTQPGFERRWITAREASDYLSIHYMTVFDYMRRGIIQSAKIGGARRIDRRRLDEAMEAQMERRRGRR